MRRLALLLLLTLAFVSCSASDESAATDAIATQEEVEELKARVDSLENRFREHRAARELAKVGHRAPRPRPAPITREPDPAPPMQPTGPDPSLVKIEWVRIAVLSPREMQWTVRIDNGDDTERLVTVTATILRKNGQVLRTEKRTYNILRGSTSVTERISSDPERYDRIVFEIEGSNQVEAPVWGPASASLRRSE